MTNIIQHKRTTVPGRVPEATQLLAGEMAINVADGKLFTRKADGTVVDLTNPPVVDGGEIVYDSLLSGLNAFWLLDRTAGNVPDVSGNNVSLFTAVDAETGTGIQEKSLALTHKNFLYANASFSNRRSISFWFKYPTLPAQNTRFMSFGTFGVAGENDGYVTLNTNGALTWHENTTGAAFSVNTPTIAANTWTHVAFVYEPTTNSTTTRKVYINGQPVGTPTVVAAAVVTNQNAKFTLGLFSELVRVELDCLGVWARPLIASEILRLYDEPYAPPAPTQAPIDPNLFINFAATAPVNTLSISVTGSSSTLFPSFNSNVYDYGVLTNTITPNASVTYTLTINGNVINGTGAVNKLIRVSHGATNYHIRLLPSDMPLGTITTQPTNNYIPGYYVASSRRDITAANYNIIYNEYGLPVWYVTNDGTPHLHQPGNNRNRTVASRNGTGARYAMQIDNAAIPTRSLSFLPATRNGNTYNYSFGNHELLELTSPPARRGNIVYNTFVPTPANGSQAVTDKAYGVYVQEQSPTGTIAWDWWTSDCFDQTALATNPSFFHMNSVDAHPVTGDVLLSCRQCSAVVCVDHTTKQVKWVIQGESQPWGGISQTANATTLANAKFLTLEDEPTLNGYEYLGPEGQHHARWAPHIDPLTPGNEIVTVFDNQSGFFPGSTGLPKTVTALTHDGTTVTGTATAHGFTTGSYVKVEGANQAVFNGIFLVTVVNANTFTYTVGDTAAEPVTATGTITATKALTYWPHSANSPAARGVIYEIDLVNNKAIHRGSAFAPNGTSGYLGSYHVKLHENGVYSHVLNFTQQHPQLVEYSDSGDGASPDEIIYAVDFPGDIYRITKVSKAFFDIDYLRVSAGLSVTVQ